MDLTKFTNESIKDFQSRMRDYTIVLLKMTAKRDEPGVNDFILEHARRNLALREEGLASIICPVFGDPHFAGLYIFNTDVTEAKNIMEEDPAVKAGIFQFDVYSCKSMPGDSLPGK